MKRPRPSRERSRLYTRAEIEAVAESAANFGYDLGWVEGTGDAAPRRAGPLLRPKETIAIIDSAMGGK